MNTNLTLRQEIADLLARQRLTIKEVSQTVRIREKDVIEHLEHIAKSFSKKGHFYIEPSVCRKCGFVFRERRRLSSPSRCPICRNEAITEPRFWIETSADDRSGIRRKGYGPQGTASLSQD